MPLAGNVFPEPQRLGSEAVDTAISKFDVDLTGQDGQPAAAGGRVEVREFPGLGNLKRTTGHGAQGRQFGVVGLQFLDVALAVVSGVHSVDAHTYSSLNFALCQQIPPPNLIP